MKSCQQHRHKVGTSCSQTEQMFFCSSIFKQAFPPDKLSSLKVCSINHTEGLVKKLHTSSSVQVLVKN